MPDAPVVLCFDQNYAPYAAVATASLVKANRYPLHIHWLVRASDAAIAERWKEEIDAPHASIDIVKIDDRPFAGWREGSHVTLATYMRLLIPQVIAAPKALYLDCDVLVTGNIRPLLTAGLRNAVLAGTPDYYFTGAADRTPPFRPLCRDRYVNAGVLLMDLDQMRRDDLLRTATGIYQANPRQIFAHDQCILNKYAEGRKALLDETWNFQVRPYEFQRAEWIELMRSGKVAILHFSDAVKPWQKWCSPWVRRGWEIQANEIGLDQSCFERELTLKKALVLVRALDRMGQYHRSTALKNNIIAEMLKRLESVPGLKMNSKAAQAPV